METGPNDQGGDKPATPLPTVIIVGFGLPGRFVAEVLDGRKVPYSVVELNPVNARSIAGTRKPVFCGDARDPELLRAAGIETAQLLAVTLPDEKVGLDVLHEVEPYQPSMQVSGPRSVVDRLQHARPEHRLELTGYFRRGARLLMLSGVEPAKSRRGPR